MTNLLTLEKLTSPHNGRKGGGEKQRMDANLGRMIAEQVALRFPHMKVTKRFAIEFALREWMSDRGLLRQAPLSELERAVMVMEAERAMQPTPTQWQ